MANGKSNTARRREVRRNVPRPGPKWLTVLRRRETLWACAFIVGFTILASLIAVTSSASPRYRLGQVVHQPIVSRVAFQAVNQQKTQERRQEAESRTPQVYTINQQYLQSLHHKFDKLIGLAELKSVDQVNADSRKQLNLTAQALRELRKQVKNGQPTAQWTQLESQFFKNLLSVAVLSPKEYQQEISRGLGRIIIRHGDPATGKPLEFLRYDQVLISATDTEALHKQVVQFVTPFPLALQETIVTMVMQDARPTYIYNAKLSDQRRDARAQQITPVTESFDANQVLVPAGNQLGIGDLNVIHAERQAFDAEQSASDLWLSRLGTIGLVLLICLGIWVYIASYNERILRNPMRGLALMGLMLIAQALAAVLTQMNPSALYATAIAPTLMVAIIMAIAYNQRFALAVGVIQTLLVMVTLNLPVGFALTLITGVAVAAAQLREVRTRSKLVVVGCWAGLAMGIVAVASELTAGYLYIDHELERIFLQDCIWAIVAGIGTGAIAQAMILPFIEKVFKITTAMTLKELNDASLPLLQRLAQEAPGTYQHSLRIADMAESAADAIGADGLLCRVGAMYHDIGKINKPMYFIENQGGGPNRHTRLSPAMSLLIIVGHVKDGIEMAREYGLPPVLRHFIESHHGTTLVEYFYHAARKQKEAEDKPGPSEFEFRYPGPKPQTKESAILLLCDGIEGAARALSEPTPVRLDQVVHAMANKRLMDGQFDECSLTLQELARIEDAVTKTLCAVYHGRIKYPQADAKDDEAEPGAPAGLVASGESRRIIPPAASAKTGS